MRHYSLFVVSESRGSSGIFRVVLDLQDHCSTHLYEQVCDYL